MTDKRRSNRRILSAAVLAGLLTGCAAGPDFRRPPDPDAQSYTAAPLPARTESAPVAQGGPQRFVEGDGVEPRWWSEFGSAGLDALVEEGLRASPTLAAAEAALRQARELLAARSGGTLYPQVDAGFSARRQRINPNALGQTGEAREFSLFDAGVSARYAPDLSGENRRALEALAANVDYRRFLLEGARLTLAANIAVAAITRGETAEQIRITESILRFQEEQLELTRERVRLGQAAPHEASALETQAEQTRAGIPLLRNRLQRNGHLLSVLIGRAPGEGVPAPIPLEEFTLPADLPLVVPSVLVRTRPDIRAAEALLHAANAEYGAAVARLYPRIGLSADLGTQALTAGALFGGGSAAWSLVGQLTQPLFNPGLPAEKRAALAAFDAAAANYREVVLESLRDVADVLRALENDAQRLSALSAASLAAESSLDSTRRRHALGAASHIELLIAQQQSQQTRIGLVEARSRRLVDSAAFYQAMGGLSKAPR